MPNPLVIQKPELPASINPQGASVFDAPGQGILRKIVGLLGLDDPQQIMGVGAAMDVGPMGGGLLDAVAQRFPRFAQAIKAYHGSPHDFEAFDTSKIGTGEGAQAYGHGLYFAESPGVAQSYRDQLSGAVKVGEQTIPVRNVSQWTPESAAASQLTASGYDIDAAITEGTRRLQESEARGNSSRLTPILRDSLATLQDWKQRNLPISEAQGGKMYEVGINAHPDQFLDWDKPLSQQHPDVKQALQQANALPESYKQTLADTQSKVEDIQGAIKLYESRLTLPDARAEMAAQEIKKLQAELSYVKSTGASKEAQFTGQTLYQSLAHDIQGETMTSGRTHMPMMDAKAEAARRIHDAGIPGIKYLDQGSRAVGEGSRNFVVFDAKTVDILKKYGLLLPAAGAGLAASQQEGQ